VAEPAIIKDDTIEQIDLLLDVWVSPKGEPRILDEDEFAEDTTLSNEQRSGAQQGLQALLALLAAKQEAFSLLNT
jgi:predicted RNA-binding protein associated with RNAse of E/G family